MQKIIGLDIGSFSIKAIEIVNTLKNYEIIGFHQVPVPHIPEIPTEDIIQAAMTKLFQENNLEPDRIVTAMPGQFFASRILQLGFSDPKKIKVAVRSELEDAMPFSLENMMIDHQLLGQQGNQTHVLAVMTKKNYIASFLELLSSVHIDPKTIDIDSLAFYNLAGYLSSADNANACMVDIGHEKTSVTIVKDGSLRMLRTVNLGGRYITEFLARDAETTFANAQRLKHRIGAVQCPQVKPFEDPHDQFLSERITLALQVIIRELGRTFYAYKKWDKSPIEKIYLSGGTTKLLNIEKLLVEQLSIPCEKLDLSERGLQSSFDLKKYQEIVPQSLAIGIRTVSSKKKLSEINFRQGPFAYVQSYTHVFSFASKFLKYAAVALFFMVGSYALKYWFYMEQISKIESQYRKELTALVEDPGQFSADLDFDSLKNQAKAFLADRTFQHQSALGYFESEMKKSPAMSLMADISQVIPTELQLDVTQFQYQQMEEDLGRLTLRVEAQNYADQASIIESVKTIASLDEVTERSSGPKPGTGGSIIEFTLQANHKQ